MRLYFSLIFICFMSHLSLLGQSTSFLNEKMIEAASRNQKDSLVYWIEKGAKINYVDENGLSAMHYSIYNREFVFKSTNSKSYNINRIIESMFKPHYFKGGYTLCKELISRGLNVDFKYNESTYLMLASQKGDLRLCKLLLDYGAKPDILDQFGDDAVEYGIHYNRIVDLLIKNKYSKEETYYELMIVIDSLIFTHQYSEALKLGNDALLRAKNELWYKQHRDIDTIKKKILVATESLGQYDYSKRISQTFRYTDYTELSNEVSQMMQYGNYYNLLEKMAQLAMNEGDYTSAGIIIPALFEYKTKYNIVEVDSIKHLFWLCHINAFFKDYKNLEKCLKRLNQIDLYNSNLEIFKYVHLIQLNFEIGDEEISKYYIDKAFSILPTNNFYEKSILFSLLGRYYYNKGEFGKAIDFFKKSAELFESNKSYDYDSYTVSLINLGQVYYKNNENIEAIKIFERLKNEYDNQLIKNLRYCFILENLSRLYILEGNIAMASYYIELGSIIRKKRTISLENENSLLLLAELEIIKKNYMVTDSLFQVISNTIYNKMNDFILNLTELQRNKFVSTNNIFFEIIASFNALQNNNASLSLNNELYRKGLQLIATQKIKNDIFNSNDNLLIGKWNKLKLMKRELIQKELSSNINHDNINALKIEIEKNESELIENSNSEIENINITWQDIQRRLQDKEAAIEFSSFHLYNRTNLTDSIMYCALLLRKGMDSPVLVPLFEQRQLDSLLVGVAAEAGQLYATRGSAVQYPDKVLNSEKLYRLIWEPLEAYLDGVKTVYYSPSGTLHQISFAALPVNNKTVLCEKYNLNLMSSTRQLATAAWQKDEIKPSSVSLFGGIQYDLNEDELALIATQYKENEILSNKRSFVNDSTQSVNSFLFLNGTLREVEAISDQFKKNGISTALYTGTQATEEQFKLLNKQPIEVIHIATHGFFNPIEKDKPSELDDFLFSGNQQFRLAPNPLLRSGVIMAGGNKVWKGNEPVAGMEDGILTAQEISDMNLFNTDLVVLSACETGLGDIDNGEGVFGLQRAFKLAGVNSIIMSLWKVPDQATSEMMQLFYEKWLSGMKKQQAFIKTQREMKNRYPNSPQHWAGFVMVD